MDGPTPEPLLEAVEHRGERLIAFVELVDADPALEVVEAIRIANDSPFGLAGQVSANIAVTMNVFFLTETILPLMALRWIAGPTSAVVP